MQVQLDRFGRLVVPKSIRDVLGLEPGSVLDLEEEGGKVLLSPVREEEILEDRAGILVFCGKAETRLGDAVRSTRSQRLADLATGL